MSGDLTEEEQSQEWQRLETSLEEMMEQLNESNIDMVFNKMATTMNIVWIQDIFIRYALCYRSQFGLSSNVISAFAKRYGIWVPDLNLKLTQHVIFNFVDTFKNNRPVETLELVSLIGDLFNYEICTELIVLQVLQILSKGNDDIGSHLGVSGIIQLMTVCGKTLRVSNSKVHDEILKKIDVSKIGKDEKLMKRLEALIELKEHDYADVPTLESPDYLSKIDVPKPVMFIVAKELKEPDDQLGEFHGIDNLEQINEQWNDIKTRLDVAVGEEEEEEEEVHVEEEKVGENDTKQISNNTTITSTSSQNIVTDMTNTEDIEFKKQIYLIIKSSLSGDEAAHKILKRRTPDDEKYKIVDILIKSSIQEATYSKFYGIISERLLNSHKAWKPAFIQIFQMNYEQLDTFEPSQLRIIGKFWGHIFATDYLGFELLEIVKINSRDSTAPSRIFVKFIFQELVADLSIDELKDRLNEEYIQPFLKGMFPDDDMEDIRYSINYFTAIGLGVLTDGMRERLVTLEEEARQEQEQEMEEEEGIEEEEEEREEEMGSRESNREIRQERGRRRSITPPRRRSRYNNDNGNGHNYPRFSSSRDYNDQTSESIQRGRQRSITPPRHRKRERSITPPRNRGRFDRGERYESQRPRGRYDPQRQRNTHESQRQRNTYDSRSGYRDDNNNNKNFNQRPRGPRSPPHRPSRYNN